MTLCLMAAVQYQGSVLPCGRRCARITDVRRIIAIIALSMALVSCDRETKAPVYTGQSEHWDQAQVPLSLQCAACHAEQFEQWAGSDHAWAWRTPDAARDAEAFHRQKLQAHGSSITFNTTPKGQYLLRDAAVDQPFEVHSVVGRTPLVQYLVRGKDGGLQAPSAAWDTEKHEWFDLFEQDARLSAEGLARRNPGDWGHWLGRGMNWDSQCAWCHMTGFRKNYNAAKDTYAATHREPGVTCIQCHRMAAAPDPKNGCLVAAADRKLSPERARDNCASCHARREELDDAFRAGDRFDDHFRLELPILPGVFWPNAMQRDEAYCETGLRHSRMGAAGVTCLDCHDPHTARLKLPQEDDSLCLRCHADGTRVNGTPAPVVAQAPAGLCPAGSEGARCVECHMPASPYMARDMRRDHSFNIPDPQLSREIGIPNACTMCHKDKDDAWAAEALVRALPEQKAEAYRLRAHAVHAALQGQGNTENLMMALRQETVPAWRATLLELLARQPALPEITAAARAASREADPLVRAAAARILGVEAEPLLADPVRLVRHAAAWAQIPENYSLLRGRPALAEVEATARHQADQPAGAMQLATLAAARGDEAAARAQYERAIRLDPASPVPYMDYAVYLARCDKLVEALQQMLDCVKVAPQNAEAQYRLGLILAEVGQYSAALVAMERAVQADPTHAGAREARDSLSRYLRQKRP